MRCAQGTGTSSRFVFITANLQRKFTWAKGFRVRHKDAPAYNSLYEFQRWFLNGGDASGRFNELRPAGCAAVVSYRASYFCI